MASDLKFRAPAKQLLLLRPRECLAALNISGGAEFRPGGLALGVIDCLVRTV